MPDDKVNTVKEIKSRNETVAFIGDGVNDAPVVALSDVGVAMGGLGSDATIETSDVVIQDDKPSKIPIAIAIGKHTKRIVWQNISFAFAVKDYEKALTLATTTAETSQALSVLAWLYRTRATSTSFYPPAKIVSAEKQTRLVFEDFDRSLELTRKYLNASDKRTEWAFMVRDIYADKARAAIEFDENIAAVKILNNAISELHELQGDEVVCSLYILRGDVNQKLKEHDAAIRDYTYPIEKKYVNCDAIFEKRGDAFAAKGEWQRAIGDYSIELRKFTYPHVSLLTRRARAYLNTGDAGKAIVDLNEAMTYHKSCSQQYQLRAEAYRMLKDETRALEDENTAARYSRNKIGCSL